jgi:hypothetical protein
MVMKYLEVIRRTSRTAQSHTFIISHNNGVMIIFQILLIKTIGRQTALT